MYRTVVPSSGSLSAFFPALSLPQRSGWRLNLGYLHSSNTYSATQSVVVSPHAVLSSGKTFWIDSYSYTESLNNKFPGGLEINLPRLRASIEYAGDIKVFDASKFQRGLEPVFCVMNFVFLDWSGASHPFNNIASCSGIQGGQIPLLVKKFNSGERSVGTATDGSWLRLDVSNLSDLRVTTKDGTVYHFTDFVDPYPDKTTINSASSNQELYYDGA